MVSHLEGDPKSLAYSVVLIGSPSATQTAIHGTQSQRTVSDCLTRMTKLVQWTPEARNGPRVRKKIAPIPLESPRGYLVRVAECFSYASPCWLTELAAFTRADDLELAERVNQLAYVLRLDPNEWRSMLYLKVKEGNRFWRRHFFGHLIAADRLNYGAPRVCAACLKEIPIWWGIWDLSIVSACPGHRCELINTCPRCGEPLSWHRPGVEVCTCGFDLREAESAEADTDLIAINALVYQSAGFPIGMGSFDLGNARFPAEIQLLALNDLIGLILAISVIERNPRRPNRPPVTDLSMAQCVARDAINVLSEWPSAFHERLRALLPKSITDRNAVTLRGCYGDFYQFLLDAAHEGDFRFLIEAFRDFVARDWPGVIRGQHRLVSESMRDRMRWIPALQAARLAGLTAGQVTDLARNGKLKGIFVCPPKSRGRVECWIDREGLEQWIIERDTDRSNFNSQAEARKILGLTLKTLESLAQSGLIEIVEGIERGFPTDIYVRREHVESIKAAFSTGTPNQPEPKGGHAVLLREAMRRYLGRDGFCELVRDVLSGTLRPVARDSSVTGILGYLFRISDVKLHVPAKHRTVLPAGFMTYAMAASLLKTNTEVVRNLVATDHIQLESESSRSSRGPRLVRTQSVEDFASSYVSLKSVADCLDVGSRAVLKVLKLKSANVLVVPLPGKGNKLFARKGPLLDRVAYDLSLSRRA